MRKLLNIGLGILIFCLFIQTASAVAVNEYVSQKLPVVLMQSLSSNEMPSNFKVVTKKAYKVSDSLILEEGTVVYLKFIKINPEKVGKTDASIETKVTKLYLPSQGRTIKVQSNSTAKLSRYKETDYTDIGIDAGIRVANHFVKNIVMPAQFVRGAIENDTGDRLESGAQKAYDKSVFSYVEKGKPVSIKAGQLATLTLNAKAIK